MVFRQCFGVSFAVFRRCCCSVEVFLGGVEALLRCVLDFVAVFFMRCLDGVDAVLMCF